jgi:hypothetical protein
MSSISPAIYGPLVRVVYWEDCRAGTSWLSLEKEDVLAILRGEEDSGP